MTLTQPPIHGHVVDFGRALREHGLVAGPSELIDAAAAAETLGFEDRERLRAALAAALLRRSGERRVFDEIFDVYFPRAMGESTGRAEPPPPLDTADDRREHAARLRDALARALAGGDRDALRRLAEQTLVDLGRLPNEASAGAFSAAQALDTLAPQTSLAAAMQAGTGTDGPLFTAAFQREELRSRIGEFRAAVEAEARRRNAEVRGRQRISRYAVRPSADRTLFILAGPQELAELRATIGPLARKLATRLASRRRHQRGTIDLRTTLRRSMATGGVPMRPAYKHRPPHKPDLVVLADFSSSVAGFSRFTILLLQALQAQFNKVKVFGFVNVCADLTDLFASAPPGSDLTEEVRDVREMTRWHKNSDYGSAFADFVEHHLDAVTPRSTVLILGDARSNHTDPRTDALHLIAERARSVIWLNPEPARSWGSGDSESATYNHIVDMHECSTIGHLRGVVSRLLPV
ncbi:MAG: VWA domain-containing protein [Dermatophilaceae bacterium]